MTIIEQRDRLLAALKEEHDNFLGLMNEDRESPIDHIGINGDECATCLLISQIEANVVSEGSCVWSEDSDGNWNTSCKQMFCLNDGTPKDNDMKYCTYCGKPLHQNLFEYES